MAKPNSEIILVRWTPAHEAETGGNIPQDYTHILTQEGTRVVLSSIDAYLYDYDVMDHYCATLGWTREDIEKFRETIFSLVEEIEESV